VLLLSDSDDETPTSSSTLLRPSSEQVHLSIKSGKIGSEEIGSSTRFYVGRMELDMGPFDEMRVILYEDIAKMEIYPHGDEATLMLHLGRRRRLRLEAHWNTDIYGRLKERDQTLPVTPILLVSLLVTLLITLLLLWIAGALEEERQDVGALRRGRSQAKRR